jgi:glycosyltransferase involved in cell wall biosynthesis
MYKPLVIYSAPVDTISGYGSRSRDLLKALLKVKGEEWDIRVLSQRWGNCPFGALDENDEEDKLILSKFIAPNLINKQPDIFIFVSVSDEFQPYGKVNIGISALVETNILPSDMIEGLNRMTFNIVSSNHAKTIAENSLFDRFDKNTNQKVGNIKLEKPVHVLFEGVDTRIFYRKESKFDLSMVKESFAFLTVGHWLPGDLYEDRKQLTSLIKSFLEAFKNKKNTPALLLKTSLGGFSITEEEILLKKIDEIKKTVDTKVLPNIYLIHGELTDEEMNDLYNHPKVAAFALTGNEGFGRPLLEFSAATGKPVITGAWSGYTDFLDRELSVYVGGKIEKIHESASNKFLLKESAWFKVDMKQLSMAFKDVHENYKKYVDNGKKQGYRCKTQFSMDKMAENLKEILDNNIPKMSVPVSLTLPKLKKIELPKAKND